MENDGYGIEITRVRLKVSAVLTTGLQVTLRHFSANRKEHEIFKLSY